MQCYLVTNLGCSICVLASSTLPRAATAQQIELLHRLSARTQLFNRAKAPIHCCARLLSTSFVLLQAPLISMRQLLGSGKQVRQPARKPLHFLSAPTWECRARRLPALVPLECFIVQAGDRQLTPPLVNSLTHDAACLGRQHRSSLYCSCTTESKATPHLPVPLSDPSRMEQGWSRSRSSRRQIHSQDTS